MKESILGPRQWAFVVITGGAACALPFVQTDNSPTSIDNALTRTDSPLTATDSSLTTSQQGAPPGADYRFQSSESAGNALVMPRSLTDFAPPLSAQRLPEWANADRSPFDELVTGTADAPKPAPPIEPLPMQPLRPWIAGPPDAASLVSNTTAPIAAPSTSTASGAIAGRLQTADQATPWSEEPGVGFTPVDQLAGSATNTPRGLIANVDQADQWPDQDVTAEEVAQATRSRERELASAIVAAPQRSPNQSSALLAAPALPASTPLQATTLPVAAQRFGQAYMSPQSATLRAPGLGEPPKSHDPGNSDRDDLNLPALPTTRKSHIIFQPGTWK